MIGRDYTAANPLRGNSSRDHGRIMSNRRLTVVSGGHSAHRGVLSRVENRRSGCSLPVAVDGAFAMSPQSGLTWLWFLFPLIEPDRRFSRIRLSEKGSRFCPRKTDGSSIERRTTPNWSWRIWSEYRLVPLPFRPCLARSHWRSLRQVCRSTAR